jgi:hypothetical protein
MVVALLGMDDCCCIKSVLALLKYSEASIAPGLVLNGIPNIATSSG